MHEDQLTEFTIRSQVQQPADIIRSATTVGAQLLRMEGKIGAIRPGSFADLLVLDANPLEDIHVLASPDKHLRLVMAGGRIVSSRLN